MQINFSRFGIPLEVITDNGPQFAAVKFKKFSDEYNFTHETISPGQSKANVRSEAAVKITKNMLINLRKMKKTPILYY